MRVVLAIDEFAPSSEAVQVVKAREWPVDTTVRVLHVIEKFVPPVQALWYDAGGDPERVKDEAIENANILVTAAAESLRTANLETETTVRFGNPAKTIVEEAREWQADLIVLGSHRYTGLKRVMSGGVGRAVVAHATCSVEIAHFTGTVGNDDE